jgi:hypothetical protein
MELSSLLHAPAALYPEKEPQWNLVVCFTPRPLYIPRKNPPMPIGQEAAWAPEAACTQLRRENSLLCLESNPGRPAFLCTDQAMLTAQEKDKALPSVMGRAPVYPFHCVSRPTLETEAVAYIPPEQRLPPAKLHGVTTPQSCLFEN